MEPIRINGGDLRRDRLEALLDWVRSVGVDPANIRPTIGISCGEREYELHVSRFVRDEHGRLIVDDAADEVVTEPVVIGIGTERSWPDLGTAARPVTVRLKAPDTDDICRIQAAIEKASKLTRERF